MRIEWQAIVVASTPIRLLALLGMSVVVCVAQAPQEEQPRLAVEIPGGKTMPPSYAFPAYGDGVSGSLYYGQNLHRLPSSDPDARQPSLLKLEFKAAGDVVSISATVYYGAFDDQHLPASAEKLEHENAGTYTGKLNDSVTLSGLEQAGLEPITLRIVSAQSDEPITPLARSDAPSLQFTFAPFDRISGTATIQNLSDRAVVALRIGNSENGTGWGQEENSSGQTPLIAPGATYKNHLSPGSSGRIVNGTYVPNPAPTELILQAALFADGSYEGDMHFAVQMAALRIGQTVQHRRIASLGTPILSDTELDSAARIKRILAAAGRLSTEPDAQMAETLRANFPGLTEKELVEAQRNFSLGMEHEKRSLALMLKQFDPDSSPNPSGLNFAAFWNAAYMAD